MTVQRHHGPILQLEGISKRFPGVAALENVHLELEQEQIHALLGENGAGKSTLIKILTGVQKQDEGHIRLAGHPVTISTPKDAQRFGISLVPQETLVVPELSIGRNILLGIESGMASRGALSSAEQVQVEAALDKIGADFDVETPAKELSVPQLRLAQIARALLQPGSIMVLDEPTAVLSEPDAEHLLERLDALRSEGQAILYVTHRLSEVMRLADRMTILRDGRLVGVYSRGEIDRDEMVRLIARDVGTRTGDQPTKTRDLPPVARDAPPRLEVTGLTAERHFADASLSVPQGRIAGIAGVQGSGHGAFVRAIGGVDPVVSGKVCVNGRSIGTGSPEHAARHGVLTVPADRRGAAIVPDLSIRANLAISGRIRAAARRWGLRWHDKERAVMEGYIADLSIRPPSTETKIAKLSGGNQQKLALARVLEGSADVLLIEEPTQGVDVSAKAEIHALLRRVARETGCAVVIASSEFEELVGLADDVYVMRSGRLGDHMTGDTTTYHKILEKALP